MRQPLLERTPRPFILPESQPPESKDPAKCRACEKTHLKFEIEYCQSICVCKPCLSIYAAVCVAIDEHGERRAIDNRRAIFLGSYGGAK